MIRLPKTADNYEEAKGISSNYLSESDILVLDGYHFDTEYQKIIRLSDCKLVVIDDIHACHYVADIVINHALGIYKSDFSADFGTHFLLGTQYALLRSPFREGSKRNSPVSVKEPILICMGGADPNNDTLKTLKECYRKAPDASYIVVLGAAYSYQKELEEGLAQMPCAVSVLQHLSAEELADCMRKCPVAILPPSTVAYEYLSIGGLLFLKVIADNQKKMFRSFIAEGLAFSHDAFGQDKIFQTDWQTLLNRQSLFFDGQQQARFINLFKRMTVSQNR